MTETKARGMRGREPRKAGNFQKLGKARKWILPPTLQKECSTADLFYQTSDVQSCKTIRVCCLKVPSL